MLNITAETAAKLYLALRREHDVDPEDCYCEDWRDDEDKNYICPNCQTREALSAADGIERKVPDAVEEDESSLKTDPSPQASV